MPVPRATLWPIGAHTVAKHEILRRYLEAWFGILDKAFGRAVYVDGFCGPGRYLEGEGGSPIIALKAAANHRPALQGDIAFWFVDERADRIGHLTEEIKALRPPVPSHFRVAVRPGLFEHVFDAEIAAETVNARPLAPTLAFLDPFGFSGFPFRIVRRILQSRSCETLITFNASAMRRFLAHPSSAIVARIVETCGTEEAREIATQPGDRIADLRDLYQRQLKLLARFVRFFTMRDRRNQPIYLLFFASNNRLGHIRMKEAMWRADPSGAFHFSDATDPRQLVLLDAEPAAPLVDLLAAHFRGQRRVTGEEVQRFVEDETAFYRTHMTAALRMAESEQSILVSDMKRDGQRRRAGTYPEGCLISFS